MSTDAATGVLRSADQEFLDACGFQYSVVVDAGFAVMVIERFTTPPGLVPATVDLLLRLPMGFPDATPDMFWVSPNITTAPGMAVPGTEQIETIVGRDWQRWSRHIAQQWRPGIDNLETYLGYVRRCLAHAGGN